MVRIFVIYTGGRGLIPAQVSHFKFGNWHRTIIDLVSRAQKKIFKK